MILKISLNETRHIVKDFNMHLFHFVIITVGIKHMLHYRKQHRKQNIQDSRFHKIWNTYDSIFVRSLPTHMVTCLDYQPPKLRNERSSWRSLGTRGPFGVKRVEPLRGSERFLDSLSRIPEGNPTTNVSFLHN